MVCAAPVPSSAKLPILHLDDHLVVVDKPPGILVVPAPGRGGATVVDLLGRQLGERVFAVHRLDEDTSGALVLARTEAARAGLDRLFAEHGAARTYHALLSHAPQPPAGRIESRLAEGADGVVRSVPRGGERAVTRYRTLCRRGRWTLVEVQPETGRRNQIRVHMAELGCPLVGDRKYGFRVRGGPAVGRVMLHAAALEFDHPVTGERVAVRCEAPEAELRP